MTSELKPCPYWLERLRDVLKADITNFSNLRILTCVEDFYNQHTRAAPSTDMLAGLVRYEPYPIDELTNTTGMIKHRYGEYVLYSEAAAVSAAKEAECVGYREYAAEKSNQVAALQAKLVQIKAQEPVGYLTHEDLIWLSNGSFSINKVIPKNTSSFTEPLYASPVSDSLKAENERLREALTASLTTMQRYKNMGYGDEVYMADLCQSVNIARAALNVEPSNDKG